MKSIVRYLKLKTLLPMLALASMAGSALALDYKSVGNNPAVAYDAPSEKGRKVYVAPRGMPVEVVFVSGEWTKVRDSAGDLFWLQNSALIGKRMLVVTAANARIRLSPDDNAAPVFSADKGVLLELSAPVTSGWIKVRHRDGQTGYIKASEVWGS